MPCANRVIVAAAGSGKTTQIVEDALQRPLEKSVVVTYTRNNFGEIQRKFEETNGCVPQNVTVATWFRFLLKDFVRPYQNFVYDARRIEGLAYVNHQSTRYVKSSDVARYYFSEGKNIYNDKISQFACLCNQQSDGLVIGRLRSLYDHIYIDEVQDLAGYDLELVELLLSSGIVVTAVGDPRQATYSTNPSQKNKKYRGANIARKFLEWQDQGKCEVEYMHHSWRCHPRICELADQIYLDYPKTESLNEDQTGHDGVFVVPPDCVDEYVDMYGPQILRYSIKTDCDGHDAINFGDAKGLTFDRVLIFPHGPLKKLLKTGDFKHVEGSAAKVYVAITRARNSVAFVYSRACALENVARYQG